MAVALEAYSEAIDNRRRADQVHAWLSTLTRREFAPEEISLLTRTEGEFAVLELAWVLDEVWCYRYSKPILCDLLENPLEPRHQQLYVLGCLEEAVLYPGRVCAYQILEQSCLVCTEPLENEMQRLGTRFSLESHRKYFWKDNA